MQMADLVQFQNRQYSLDGRRRECSFWLHLQMCWCTVGLYSCKWRYRVFPVAPYIGYVIEALYLEWISLGYVFVFTYLNRIKVVILCARWPMYQYCLATTLCLSSPHRTECSTGIFYFLTEILKYSIVKYQMILWWRCTAFSPVGEDNHKID